LKIQGKASDDCELLASVQLLGERRVKTPMTMLGMDPRIDEVGIFERRRVLLERALIEVPGRKRAF